MPACNAPVSSEDFADFIYHYGVRTPEEVFAIAKTRCVDFVNREYAIIYVPLRDAEPISLSRYTYTAIPKLYGLQDTTALESSGIIQSFAPAVLKCHRTGRHHRPDRHRHRVHQPAVSPCRRLHPHLKHLGPDHRLRAGEYPKRGSAFLSALRDVLYKGTD